MPVSFFDTNVLLYLVSGDTAKVDRAEALLGQGGVISVQVLNEIANVAHRKMRMTWPEAHAFLSTLRALLNVEPITVETHETGLALAQRYTLSTYDAMIAAAALNAMCSTVWLEDMQDGLALGKGLRIINALRLLEPQAIR